MSPNNILIILRRLWRQKLYSFLNITGLSLGLAISLLMFSYVSNELKYDRHYPNADRIFRIAAYSSGDEGPTDWANGAPLMAAEMNEFFPEIISIVRMRPTNEAQINYIKDSLNQTEIIANGFWVDSSFFEVFGSEIINGNKTSPLAAPSTTVLSERIANGLFGEEDPIGKVVEIMGNDFEVTAIMKDFPEHSHFNPEYLIDWSSFVEMLQHLNLMGLYNNKHWAGVYTYVLFDESSSVETASEKMDDFRASYFEGEGSREEIISRGWYAFQPVKDIHLKSHLEQEIQPNGNILYVRIFALAALFIIIIAGVNYVNISTAGSFHRIKESGVRKVAGASKSLLIRQFLEESVLVAVMAAFIAILIIDLVLPFYNSITAGDLRTFQVLSGINIIFFILITLVLGIAAGAYPAVFISRFNPIEAMNENKNPVSLTSRLRTALVVLQFVMSIFMIFVATSIYRQMNFFITKDLGFDKENILVLAMDGQARGMAINNPQTLKDELGQLPFISGISFISHLPGERFSVEGFAPDGITDEQDQPPIRFLRVDEDFLDIMNIKLASGRNLRLPSPRVSEFILNKKAVESLQLSEALGTKGTTYFGQYGEIVGITEDFHYASLQHEIEPLILEYHNDAEFRNLWLHFMLVKFEEGDLLSMIDELKNKLVKTAPGTGFEYFFLDESFNRNYENELRLRNLFRAFALFAIFIACLGLFGLSAFSAALRTKEIGIRKSMGASLWEIAIMLPRRFIILILLALVIALPTGFLFINWWLQNFAYHISPGLTEILVASLAALIIGLLSVSYTSIRAGAGNPIDTLRYE